MTMRVGFVGCGLIAGFHAWGLGRTDDVTIGAVCDTDPARAAAFAEAQGATAVATVDEVVAASDAVYVTTWTSAHAAMNLMNSSVIGTPPRQVLLTEE